MTIDPQAAAFLRALDEQGWTDLSEMTVEEVRGATADLGGPPEAVYETVDTTAPGPAGDVPIRIYRSGSRGPQPAIVYFHGGAFVRGSIETHDKLCRILTNASSSTVVSVDYRLAPEHPFPAAVEDSLAATQWILREGESIGIEPSRVAVAGDSSGGNLAAVVAQLSRQDEGPRLVHQLLIYPAVDGAGRYPSMTENGEGYFITARATAWSYRHYLPESDLIHLPTVSPARASDLTGLPPATIVTAGFDVLRDEAQAYADALAAAGVPVTHLPNAGMIHGFWAMTGIIDHARVSIDQACASLRPSLHR